MNVAIVTHNPAKIRAVETVFADVFGEGACTLHPLPLKLDLPEQPMEDAIADGAQRRAEAALAQSDADVGVGIEAGLMTLPGTERWMTVQVCAIAERGGGCHLGVGPGYELPEQILDAVMAGEPLREAFERLLNVPDPHRWGAIYYLSKGRIDRVALTMEAVRMALIPWQAERKI